MCVKYVYPVLTYKFQTLFLQISILFLLPCLSEAIHIYRAAGTYLIKVKDCSSTVVGIICPPG